MKQIKLILILWEKMAKDRSGGPANKSEKDPNPNRYPIGKQMKKGAYLDCIACKGKNPLCKGCGGTGKFKL